MVGKWLKIQLIYKRLAVQILKNKNIGKQLQSNLIVKGLIDLLNDIFENLISVFSRIILENTIQIVNE